MKRPNIYMFPMRDAPALKARNPYVFHLCSGLQEHYTIVNYGNNIRLGALDIARYFFKTDVFYFNWIENASLLQAPFFLAFILAAKIMGKKVVWTHHNRQPHNSGKWINKYLISYLSRKSDYVVVHTKESYPLLDIKKRKNKTVYFFHPFFSSKVLPLDSGPKTFDLLIWGNVRKSKGVDEFLKHLDAETKLDQYRIRIIGKFESESYYEETVNRYKGKYMEIENRFIDADELQKLHQQARFVFFPYTGPSVLNSGALITSLPKGATIIGPDTGAFREAGELGFIHTYTDFNDVLRYLDAEGMPLPANLGRLPEFCEMHTWSRFATHFKNTVSGRN